MPFVLNAPLYFFPLWFLFVFLNSLLSVHFRHWLLFHLFVSVFSFLHFITSVKTCGWRHDGFCPTFLFCLFSRLNCTVLFFLIHLFPFALCRLFQIFPFAVPAAPSMFSWCGPSLFLCYPLWTSVFRENVRFKIHHKMFIFQHNCFMQPRNWTWHAQNMTMTVQLKYRETGKGLSKLIKTSEVLKPLEWHYGSFVH